MSEVVPAATSVTDTPTGAAAVAAVEAKPVEKAAESTATVLTEKANPETKDGEGKPAEAAPVVPEKYEFKLPEGVSLHPELQKQFEGVARDLKLTNEQAQKFVDLEMARQSTERDALNAERKAWIEQGKTDKDIGGAKYGETLRLAQAAFEKFADHELIGLLEATGLGDHPAFLRAFAKIAKGFGEENTGGTTSSSSSDKSLSFAEQFYAGAAKPVAAKTTS